MKLEIENIETKQIEFLKLYESSRENLVRFSKSMTRNIEDAKDLVQETTLTAYEKFYSLKNPKAFTSFLFTIASRIYKRKIWRRRIFFNFNNAEEKEFLFDNLLCKETNPEKLSDINTLKLALDRLPTKYKEAIILFEINGLSMTEISEIQGISISGAKSRVQRGRKILEQILLKEISDISYDELNIRAEKIQKLLHNIYGRSEFFEGGLFNSEVIHEYR